MLLTFALDEPAALDAPAVFARAQAEVKQPMIFATLGLENSVDVTVAKLTGQRIPAFQSPERAANAVRALVQDSRARHRRHTSPIPSTRANQVEIPARDEASAKALLRDFGIRSPLSQACSTADEALAAFETMTRPIVVKVLDPSITHKTEVGGVHLGVRTREQLQTALARIDSIPGKHSARAYFLEEMAAPGVDLILGARRDPSFGPTLLIGLGGVEAEALKDVSIRLVPLTRLDALEMLSDLRGSALLDGWRGAQAADREAIVAAMLAAAQLIASQPMLEELDINPLRCSSGGVLALDALMIWKDAP